MSVEVNSLSHIDMMLAARCGKNQPLFLSRFAGFNNGCRRRHLRHGTSGRHSAAGEISICRGCAEPVSQEYVGHHDATPSLALYQSALDQGVKSALDRSIGTE